MSQAANGSSAGAAVLNGSGDHAPAKVSAELSMTPAKSLTHTIVHVGSNVGHTTSKDAVSR
jgi:hypothetical protein